MKHWMIMLALLSTLACNKAKNEGEARKAEAETVPATPTELVIWAHAVHKDVLTGKAGGDLASEFEQQFNAKLRWETIPWAQMQDKVLRELSAPEGQADLIFLNDSWVNPTSLSLFVPLNQEQRSRMIDDDIPQGLLDRFSFDGNLYLVPYRNNVQLLHYNEALLQGMAPPKTMAELAKIAKAVSGKRSDGAQVYGLNYISKQTAIEMVMAFGGTLLNDAGEVKVDEQPVRDAVDFLADLYRSGAIPPDLNTLDAAANRQLYTNGLLAMLFHGDNYYLRFNNPEKSGIAGSSKVTFIPGRNGGVANSKISPWGVGVPKNSKPEKRQLAWDFIAFVSSRDAQRRMALNGNSPIRVSVFQDPDFINGSPYAPVAAKALQHGRSLLPPVEASAQVTDIFEEEVQSVLLGKKDTQTAMASAAKRMRAAVQRYR